MHIYISKVNRYSYAHFKIHLILICNFSQIFVDEIVFFLFLYLFLILGKEKRVPDRHCLLCPRSVGLPGNKRASGTFILHQWNVGRYKIEATPQKLGE